MALDRTWYNTLVNDDGTNTVGSVWDKSDVDALMDAIDVEIAGVVANVKTWGATGDGTTDDVLAIQAAIDAVSLTVSGVLFFPTGHYKVSTALIISKSIKLVGASMWGVTIRGDGMTTGDYVIDVDGDIAPDLNAVEISNLTIMSNDSGRPDLLRLNRVADSMFTNLVLRDGRHGIVLQDTRTFTIKFDHIMCLTKLTGNALFFDNCAGGQFSFTDCSWCAAIGLKTSGATLSIDAIRFDGCSWEGCDVVGQVAGLLIRNLVFDSSRFEANLAPLDIRPTSGQIVAGFTLDGCMFDTTVEAAAVLLAGDAGHVTGVSVTGCYFKGYSSYALGVLSDTLNGQVTGNVLNSTPLITSARRPYLWVHSNSDTAGVPKPSGVLDLGTVAKPSKGVYIVTDANAGVQPLTVGLSVDGAGLGLVWFRNAAGSAQGSIAATNSTTTAYNTSSDKRLKNDLGIATDVSVLERTVIHDFEWRATGQPGRGVFAQDAIAVHPPAITPGTDETNEDGTLLQPWAADYSKYVPELIVGWQRHQTELRELRAAVATLLAKRKGGTA
jgi:hypothetical protein